MTDSAIRVLLVDDHHLIREAIRSLLSAEPGILVAGSLASGKEALVQCDLVKPDVVLLDMRMPDMDGLTTLLELRKRNRGLAVLVLSSHKGDESIFRALSAGAAGYLAKSAHADELVAAIRQARYGRVSPAVDVASRLAQRIYSAPLTSREVAVLERVAQGLSNKCVADSLGLAEGTVKNHINRLMEKLGARDRTHAVTLALQRGFIHLDGE